ncbi:MAG: integrase, partial [Pseudomonadota bacterium]
MSVDHATYRFQSVLAPFMEKFIQEKRACGYRCIAGAKGLWYLDCYLSEYGLDAIQLPKAITKQWLTKRDHEARTTQQNRICLARQFARFLIRHGYPAYVPDSTLSVNEPSNF